MSVLAYGAKGDGITDDTAAIHTARGAATAGQHVYFPAGTYLHTGLTSTKAGESWNLEPGAVLKLKDGANTHCLTITHPNFTLRGGAIDGNQANQTVTAKYGVFIATANDATVDGVTIRSIKDRGVYSRNSDRTTVQFCKISDCGENAILVEPTDTATAPVLDPVIRNNFVDRSAEPAGTIVEGGIKVHGNLTSNQKVLRAKIQGNTVVLPDSMANTGGAQICIELHTNAERGNTTGNTTRGGTMGISVDKSAYSIVAVNNITRFSYYGIEWAASPDGSCANNNVDGDGLGVVGVVQTTAGSHRTTINGNTIRGITQDGVSLNGGNDSTISANIIVIPSGARYGINMAGGPSGVSITGNAISTSAANYGMNIQPCNNVVIAGNTLSGNGVGLKAIAVDRSTQVIISGNSMRNFTQHGVLLFAQSTFTLDNITVFGNEFSSVGTTVGFQLSNGGALGSAVLLGQTRYGITLPSFTTAGRPSAATAGVGSKVYDKTLFKTITSDGTNWRDETGAIV
ncbi:3D (Asp-Asp-Asp) domain-containing protein [Arthrobacter oryzae]|uniref:right-handed parallel beta-helix repeat-containing protein n=1 Tax=Arthrobacter oryzae TaxID=409290 RepID=UPI002787E179|nr:right-handed parallel beta-helix repeat-containing protein [Arthrobacter oryzae]MDP9986454.1 3D (Asp-Asp-Asp) domain-containing protein [Arthrobacter oryzae]